MASARFNPLVPGAARRRSTAVIAVLGAALLVALAVNGTSGPTDRARVAPDGSSGSPAGPPYGTPSPEPAIEAAPPPSTLPVVDYGPAPRGFPADPAPMSALRLGEGLRPIRRVAAYDAPGGRPRAFLAPTISGVELTMPIVERRSGWAAVLLPSANRTVAWVPPGPWTTVVLRDLVVVVRRTHRLHWYRDDRLVRSWPVSLGLPVSPTPLGRTFILGTSRLPGRVYADTEVFALGSVPDDPGSVPSGLRGAHIGLHTWYHDGELGRNTTNGCIRLTRSGQERLLAELRPGTEVLVLDRFTAPSRLPGAPDPA
ncbi:L,D-transpeptidase family protein [Plantactinospora sp. CA-290183]|uniref:L,D-transpeptidase n=1 Tax=Plantactinospora sp. CA-290183 TaxID=3240006 RepID=UPI003D90D048